jgi:aminoglycoside phosphotransferase (APT) family kinase protein
MNQEKISSRLLEYLRTELKNPNLNYRTAPKLIGQGFETFSYKFQLENTPNELGKPLKLRLFPETIENTAYKEGTIQNLLLENDYPVARAHIICENKKHLGGEFIISDFLSGKTLAETLPFKETPDALADIHVKLHQINPSKIIEALKSKSISPEIYDGTIWGDTRAKNIRWLKPAVTWIKENEPDIERSVLRARWKP